MRMPVMLEKTITMTTLNLMIFRMSSRKDVIFSEFCGVEVCIMSLLTVLPCWLEMFDCFCFMFKQ